MSNLDNIQIKIVHPLINTVTSRTAGREVAIQGDGPIKGHRRLQQYSVSQARVETC